MVRPDSKLDEDWERKLREKGEKRIWREKMRENREGAFIFNEVTVIIINFININIIVIIHIIIIINIILIIIYFININIITIKIIIFIIKSIKQNNKI